VEFPDDNAPGAMLWFSPHKLIDLGVGVADATGSWEGIDKNPFVIGEVAFKPTIGGRQGNYRFYGWLNGKDHTEWKDATKTKERNIGFGLSFDQALSDAITAFARYGRQDQKVAQVDQAWSAGLELSGGLYGREKDALGMAYGMALLGKDYEEVTQAGGTLIGDEQHAEIYYRWHVHDHLEISPNVQWVRNINGESAHGDVWAFGVRAHASF
jgi:carbohydrate-selective porin OprB